LQEIDFRECPDFLTIGVQHFADLNKTHQFFQQEINELTGYYYPTDAIKENFIKNITQINEKNYTNLEELIKDYKNAIFQNLHQIALYLKKSVNFDQIKLEMDDKFSKLAKGKDKDKEFLREEALTIRKSLIDLFRVN